MLILPAASRGATGRFFVFEASGWGTAAVTDPVEVMVRGHTERDIMEGRRLVLTS